MAPRARVAPVHAAVVGLAVVLAVAPRPADLVERGYGQVVYPPLQRALTAVSNVVPFALVDVLLVAALLLIAWWALCGIRLARATRRLVPVAAVLGRMTVLVAAGYVWFVAVWGLNYARPPIDARLALPPGAPTETEVRSLAETAVHEANAGYDTAQGVAPPDAELARALHVVERRHHRPMATEVGRPKRSLLGSYFRAAGVDGLTAPWLLETLLNPDLIDAERPFVLAHEWAHLSGYAAEADANFVAWLTTMESTANHHRYSGWLFLLSEAARQMSREHRRVVMAALAEGPRRDLAAIARRAAQRIDLVERVGWRVYDGYLRAQGVDEGIASYSRVVELIVRARRGAALGEGTRR